MCKCNIRLTESSAKHREKRNLETVVTSVESYKCIMSSGDHGTCIVLDENRRRRKIDESSVDLSWNVSKSTTSALVASSETH